MEGHSIDEGEQLLLQVELVSGSSLQVVRKIEADPAPCFIGNVASVSEQKAPISAHSLTRDRVSWFRGKCKIWIEPVKTGREYVRRSFSERYHSVVYIVKEDRRGE